MGTHSNLFRYRSLLVFIAAMLVSGCGSSSELEAAQARIDELEGQLASTTTRLSGTTTTRPTTTTARPTTTTAQPTTTTLDEASRLAVEAMAVEACSNLVGRSVQESGDVLREVIAGSGSDLITFATLVTAVRAYCGATYDNLPRSKWTRSVWQSPLDDSQAVAFFLDGNLPIEGSYESVTPTLILRCLEGTTDAYIVTGLSANPELGLYNEYTVVLRFDDDAAFTVRAGESTDGESLFLPSPISIIKQMPEHDHLLFQFTPFDSDPGYSIFDLAGALGNVEELRATCGW